VGLKRVVEDSPLRVGPTSFILKAKLSPTFHPPFILRAMCHSTVHPPIIKSLNNREKRRKKREYGK